MQEAVSRPPLNLVMPMAGRGSRFAEKGFTGPKPLIDLAGRPFFWWATESLRRCFSIRRLVYVVLEEHIRDHAIDRRLRAFYPEAHVAALPDITRGALETALYGVKALDDDAPLVVNDCDHAFEAGALARAAARPDLPAGMLSHFHSSSPAYSYAEYDAGGRLVRTAEKNPISNLATAGAYWFKDAATLLKYADSYTASCPYPEWFISGIYNEMISAGEHVQGAVLEKHISFGTVAEYDRARGVLGAFSSWISGAPESRTQNKAGHA